MSISETDFMLLNDQAPRCEWSPKTTGTSPSLTQTSQPRGLAMVIGLTILEVENICKYIYILYILYCDLCKDVSTHDSSSFTICVKAQETRSGGLCGVTKGFASGGAIVVWWIRRSSFIFKVTGLAIEVSPILFFY